MFDVKFMFRGCKINISVPFLVLFTALLLMENSLALLWGVLAAFVHECGHIWAMILRKSKPRQIYFRTFSVYIIDSGCGQRDYNSDIFIMFAGPLANVILGTVFYCLYSYFEASCLLSFAQANFFLAAFNILPIESLDGGQIVLNLLIRKFKVQTAEKITLLLSIFILFPLAILGFYILLQSTYNFSLLFLSCYLMAVLLFKNKNWYC